MFNLLSHFTTSLATIYFLGLKGNSHFLCLCVICIYAGYRDIIGYSYGIAKTHRVRFSM